MAELTFSASCGSACSDCITKSFATNKGLEATVAAAVEVQSKNFKSMSLLQKQQFVYLCSQATIRKTKDNPAHHHQPFSKFAFPLLSDPNEYVQLCSKCFRSTLNLHYNKTWKRICNGGSLCDIKPSKQTEKLLNVYEYINSRKYNDTISLVVSKDELESRYTTTIILQKPTLQQGKGGSGIISYDQDIILNGKVVAMEKDWDLDIDNNESVAIAVKQSELIECIRYTNGKLKVQFAYPDQSLPLIGETNYVILSIITKLQDSSTGFHPTNGDFELFRLHKTSIVAPGRHHVCEGYYFAVGACASESAHDDIGTPLSINRYVTKDKGTVPSFIRLYS